MRSEADITSAIKAALDRLGIFHFKFHIAKNYYGIKGVSDIIGALPGSGRAFFIEVKKEGWKPPKKGTKAYEHYAHQLAFIVSAKTKGYALGGFATSIDEALEIIGMREIV